MRAKIWVCPQCGNYYGSSSAPDLSVSFNQDSKGLLTFPRSRCPECKLHGIEIDRVPVEVQLPMP